MTKLIKISDAHYIVVGDSEIKENHWYFDITTSQPQKKYSDLKSKDKLDRLKITHSTQPLGFLNEKGITTANLKPDWTTVKQLSLLEIEEVINEYSWRTEFEKANLKYGSEQHSFFLGFKAHQELVKDKLFNIPIGNEIKQITREEANLTPHFQSLSGEFFTIDLQSLLPKTEWDIEFDEQGKFKLK